MAGRLSEIMGMSSVCLQGSATGERRRDEATVYWNEPAGERLSTAIYFFC
jgi:hypothetical protein